VIYRFANCSLDAERHSFVRDGEELHLEPQVFELLRVLLDSDGALVTREDLIERVWGGLNISDATISVRIGAARRAVGDSGKSQGIIQTVSRRGFRLAASVERETGPARAGASSMRQARTEPMLAVLPFEYRPSDANDVLAEGIVEEVTAALSRVGGFRVIARQSAFAFREDRPEIPVVAERLGADYLLEGSVRRSGDRVRITADLVSERGVSLWSARFDDRLDDLFDLQERIAVQVAGQLPVKLRSAEIARARTPEERRRNTQYDLVLRAMPHFWAHRGEANARAVELLSEAVDRDPEYVPALAYLAWALVQKPSYMWSDNPREDRERALAFAQRAAERVSDDPQSLVAISAAYSMAVADRVPALSFAKRALAIDPNNAWGHMRLGWALIYDGRPEAALESFERARTLSPLDPFLFNMNIGTAVAHSRIERLDLAIPILEETLACFPGVAWAYRLLASMQARNGNEEAAHEALRKLAAAYPGLTLQHLMDSVPPTIVEYDKAYLDGLRAAGLSDG
jgi:TolB-like protein/Tfp pilus assembly protein PilF